MWSGSAQNGRSAQDVKFENDGDGSTAAGNAGQRVGWGRNSRSGADGQLTPDVGQDEVHDWITLQGNVSDVDESARLIRLTSGEVVTVEGRPWQFTQEQGFSASAGDEIALTGFYECENLEAGQLANITDNLVIEIRQESGRPLWARGGRRS